MKTALDRRWLASAMGAAMISLLIAPLAHCDDLVTRSGTIYHDVKPVRVEPDGVTWEHAGGVAKVDFADSPPAVRQAYHYDPAAAAAYHDAQAQIRQQEDARTQQVLQTHEEQKRAQFQAASAAFAAAGTPTDDGTALVLRRAASPAASAETRALGEQIAARNAKAAEASNENIIVGSRIWSILPRASKLLPRLNSYHTDHFLDVPNAQEYQAALHHAAGDFPTTSIADAFYTPSYATRSYYEDVDRSAAFARGVPLKQ